MTIIRNYIITPVTSARNQALARRRDQEVIFNFDKHLLRKIPRKSDKLFSLTRITPAVSTFLHYSIPQRHCSKFCLSWIQAEPGQILFHVTNFNLTLERDRRIRKIPP